MAEFFHGRRDALGHWKSVFPWCMESAQTKKAGNGCLGLSGILRCLWFESLGTLHRPALAHLYFMETVGVLAIISLGHWLEERMASADQRLGAPASMASQ